MYFVLISLTVSKCKQMYVLFIVVKFMYICFHLKAEVELIRKYNSDLVICIKRCDKKIGPSNLFCGFSLDSFYINISLNTMKYVQRENILLILYAYYNIYLYEYC